MSNPSPSSSSKPVVSKENVGVPRKRRAFAVTLLFYGLFLIALGIAGYSNYAEKPAMALVLGGAFGGIHLLWSYLWNRRNDIAKTGVVATLVMVLCGSAWQTVASWQVFLDGDPTKKVVAFLWTAMLLGTLRVFLRYISLPKAAS